MANTKVRLNQGLIESVATPGQFLQGPFYLNLPTSDVSVAWTAVPTLQNSWANKSGYAAMQYKVSAGGTVTLRGVIDTGTKAAGTLITTLPVGARPPAKTVVNVTVTVDATSNSAGTVVIDTDGTVKVGGTALTASSYISFEGVEFDTNAT